MKFANNTSLCWYHFAVGQARSRTHVTQMEIHTEPNTQNSFNANGDFFCDFMEEVVGERW